MIIKKHRRFLSAFTEAEAGMPFDIQRRRETFFWE
jgi:hypothetical protein